MGIMVIKNFIYCFRIIGSSIPSTPLELLGLFDDFKVDILLHDGLIDDLLHCIKKCLSTSSHSYYSLYVIYFPLAYQNRSMMLTSEFLGNQYET